MADIIIGDEQPRRVYQVGNIPQSEFAVPFPFLADTDVHVVVNERQADEELDLGADYTVTGAGTQSGAVTLTTPVKNCSVTVFRELVIERSTVFPGAGTLKIPALNREFDRLLMIDQQQQDLLERSLSLPASDDLGTNTTLPVAQQRAGRLFVFDEAGRPKMSDVTVAQLEGPAIAAWLDGHSVGDVTGYIGDGARARFPTGHNLISKSSVLVVIGGVKQEPTAYSIDGQDVVLVEPAPLGVSVDIRVNGVAVAVSDASGSRVIPDATGAVSRALASRAAEALTVKDFGCKGDGVSDDTAAFQLALTHNALRGGGRLLVPEGTYKLTGILHCGANLHLIMAPGARLKRFHNGSFLSNDLGVASNVGGYNGNGNITIDGGVWDGNSVAYYDAFNVLNIGYCDGFTWRNSTILDVIRAHPLDLSASKNVLIENCRFLGFATDMGAVDDGLGADRMYAEAIQIDQNVPGSFAFGGSDRTPCQNVTVRACYFGPNPAQTDPRFGAYGVAVGSHGAVYDRFATNITVENCVIEGCLYAGIRALKWRQFTARNNRFTGCNRGVLVTAVGCNWDSANDATGTPTGLPQAGADHVIAANTFTDCPTGIAYLESTFNAPTYAKHDGVVITDNVMRWPGGTASSPTGITLRWVSRAMVRGNRIHGPWRGVYFRFVDDVDLIGNTVTDTEVEGVYVDESTETSFAGLGLTADIRILGNYFTNIGYNGVYVNGAVRRVDLTNNTLLGVSTAAATRYGLVLGSGATGVWIDGNAVRDDATKANKPVYGIYATPSCSDVRIGRNNAFGSTKGVNNLATGMSSVAGVTTAATDPTRNDDGTKGYAPGAEWYNSTRDVWWTLRSNTAGAAQWVYKHPVKALAQSHIAAGVAASSGGAVAETQLWAYTIPANTLGSNDSLRITMLWSFPGSTIGKTLRVRIGTAFGTGLPQLWSTTTSTSGQQGIRGIAMLSNRNSPTVNITFSGVGVGAGSTVLPTQTAIDFTQAQTLYFSGQFTAADAGSITLESVLIEVIREGK